MEKYSENIMNVILHSLHTLRSIFEQLCFLTFLSLQINWWVMFVGQSLLCNIPKTVNHKDFVYAAFREHFPFYNVTQGLFQKLRFCHRYLKNLKLFYCVKNLMVQNFLMLMMVKTFKTRNVNKKMRCSDGCGTLTSK